MTRFFDSRASSWDETTSPGDPAHLGALAASLGSVAVPPERVLDIGCGTGAATIHLAREYPTASVRGVDISERMIDRARAKIGLDPSGRVAFKVADASRLPFDDDSFDLISQVNMPVFRKEITRVLRPGGYVIVVSSSGARTPFHTPEDLLARRFRPLGVETVHVAEHGRGTYYVGRLRG